MGFDIGSEIDVNVLFEFTLLTQNWFETIALVKLCSFKFMLTSGCHENFTEIYEDWKSEMGTIKILGAKRQIILCKI